MSPGVQDVFRGLFLQGMRKMAGDVGFEPTAPGFGGQYSIQLS